MGQLWSQWWFSPQWLHAKRLHNGSTMELGNISIAFLTAIIPALCWLALFYHKDYRDPEPKKVIAQTFLMGMVAGLPFLLLRLLMIRLNIASFLFGELANVIVFAALEEIAKLSAAIFVVTRHKRDFNQLIDGVVYAIAAALGFAFMENLFYLSSFLAGSAAWADFIDLVAFRSLGTMLAHLLFSGMAGLIWAYAYFSTQIAPFQQKHLLAFELKDFINHEILTLHIIRENILKARPSRRGGHEKKVLVLEGIVLAAFLHIIFNLTTQWQVLGANATFLLVPAIITGFLYVSYLFTKKLNQKMLKVV